MEQQIAYLQQELVDIAALKANQQWRELGETSTGYLKLTITAQQTQRTITAFQRPIHGHLCVDTESLVDAAGTFYQQLYTADPIDELAITNLFSTVPSTCRTSGTSGTANQFLLEKLTIDDLRTSAKRAPSRSSPGPDGLPYELWYLVLQHPLYHDLACQVYNDTLLHAIFPLSWLGNLYYSPSKEG